MYKCFAKCSIRWRKASDICTDGGSNGGHDSNAIAHSDEADVMMITSPPTKTGIVNTEIQNSSLQLTCQVADLLNKQADIRTQ